MKKIYPLILFYLVSLSAAGETKEVSLQYSQKDFTYHKDKNGSLYISSQVHSVSYGSDTESPALPILSVGYLIGGNESYEKVSMKYDEELIFSDIMVAPNPAIIETNTITEYNPIPVVTDYKNKFYPSHEIEFTGTHLMGGFKYITFLICPFSYDASTKQLFLKTNITLSIETFEQNAKESSTKTTPTIAYKDNCMLKNLKHLVVNPDQIDELYGDTVISYNNQGRSQINYKYLIITNNTLKPVFQNLADWKTTKGCRSKVLTVEEINSLYTGSSSQVRIKKALKDYYNGTHSGLQYVLLGGTIGVVPARMCYIKTKKDTTYVDNTTPTDLYYACFDNNFEWNANGNHTYGELSENGVIGDSVDLSPEIVVTRVPVRTVDHATAFVDRIINYEKNPNTENWENKILMGGHMLSDWDNDSIISDAEINADSLYRKYIQQNWTGSRTKLFNLCTGPFANQFTKSNLQEKLEQGYTFVDITTHGDELSWAARSYNDSYRTDSAENLKNTGYTIITTIACNTNAFDTSCLSRAFISNANSGVLGYLGCSRKGWGYYLPDVLGYSFKYNGEFYKQLFTDANGGFGLAVTNSKESFIPLSTNYLTPYRWIMFGLNPIGDPEMPVFLDVPRRFESLALSLSNGILNVNTDESDCTICVSSTSDSGDSYYEVQNGTTATFSSVLDGYTVCISKPGFIPFVATCSSIAYLQNDTINGDYNVVSRYAYAGSDVTTSKPQGEVIIQNGNVEIHGKDGVTIKNDFTVQQGAKLKIVTGN